MRKMWFTVALSLVLSLTVWGTTPAKAMTYEEQTKAEVQLTKKQKKEIDKLYQEAFAKMREVINKYAEYGVITKEKADMIIAHMDKRYEMLKQNDFIPKWKKHNKAHQHHHQHHHHE